MRSASLALALLPGSILFAREYGPALGAKLPEFQLKDQDGKAQSLKSLLGPKGAIILLYRSADWCPFCKAQLVELEQNRDEFKKLGLGVAAISYDTPAILQHFAARKSIHYPLLSDADSNVIRELGLLNETIGKNTPFYGIPYPGFFILDGNATIMSKYFEDDYRERYTSAGILAQQFGLIKGPASKEVVGRQLSLTATASNSIVAAGQRIILTLDIVLKPNMHVYAPGVEGYIPIDWAMKESDAGAASKVDYPASVKLHLPVIDETVPVYRDRVRFTREVTIGQDAKVRPSLDSAGKLKIEGTLRYQACDDQVCYIPQVLPVEWVLSYADFDRERVPKELQRK
jgi:peroxiredoxin